MPLLVVSSGHAIITVCTDGLQACNSWNRKTQRSWPTVTSERGAATGYLL